MAKSPSQSPRMNSYKHDDSWEDVDEDESQPMTDEQFKSLSRPSSPHGPTRSARKRKILSQKSSLRGASTRKPPPQVQPTPKPEPSAPPRKYIETQEIVDGALDGATFTLRYLFDIFSTAVHLLKRPLYLVAFLWLLALILSYISSTLRGAFAPLCYLPGLYGSRFCTSPKELDITRSRQPQWADYPKLVDVQSATFEQLLDEAVGSSGLSLDIKKAEMATGDLITLVRTSELKSKNALGDALVDFVSDARKTGRDLTRLTSKIGGAVDNILAVNDYALHEIEAAQARRPTIGSLYGLIPSREPSTTDIVMRTFDEAMSVLSTAMERLILEAEVSLANLAKLEERLSTIHDIISREDSSISSQQQDVLGELWTILGGNKKTLKKFETHLGMLKDLGAYRRKALAHVVAALQSLQSMSSDMEDLRERVAAPELVGSKIPVEVHIRSIRSGLDRLKEGRVRANKLEQETINKVLGINAASDLD